MRKFITFFLVILINSEVLAIDLHDSLSSAYENNAELKIARTTFLNEIEQFPQALSNFMPKISAKISANDYKNKGKSQFSRKTSEYKDVQRVLSIEQPIFNGGGSVASLKAAQSGFRAARGKFYAQEQKVILSLIKTYLECYSTSEKYNISENSVEYSKKQLESTEVKLKLGESTETEVAKARAALAISETNRLDAYAKLQSAKADFFRMFGTEPIDIKIPSLPNDLPPSLEALLQKATLVNPEIDSIRNSTAAAKASEFVAKAALLPRVSFKVDTGRSYYDLESRGTSLVNSNSVTSSVSMTIPIYEKGGAEYSEIRKTKNQTRLSTIQLNEQVKIVYSNAIASWETFNTAKSRIISSSQGVEYGKTAYDGSVQEELVGTKTILDVLDAQEQLQKAQIQNVDANVAYIFNAYQIKSLIGQLTAKSLKLKNSYFSPEHEFKKIKSKLIIGF